MVTALVPEEDTLRTVLTCPSEPSASVTVVIAELASTSVIAEVTSAVKEPPAATKLCEAPLSPNQLGMLLNTSSTVTLLLIGVP